ncbi:MAG: efflux RND transporter permease subunit, partial [Xanthomonadales bacterium]|nr:efflux RND transporter permease subunit [Xanthomonadales bacterium]
NALRSENVELPAGRLESSEREFTLRTDTGFADAGDFRRMVVGRGAQDELVRLGDVAEVRLGAENERSIARANRIPAVSLAIEQLSTANTVEVSKGVRAEAVRVAQDLPEGMRLEVNYDRAEFIEASMNEVYKALGFAIALVLLVIYVFLGSFRAMLIPAVVVPVSVVATFMVIGAMDYSINILTLLGLVLAIGLVVDDAIVVLENIYRRIEEGQEPLLAALEGAKEIGFAVVATTLVLVAVFVPLSFIQGEIGRLFNEFGITLAAAVLFSSLVALTLSPMMASKLFRADQSRGRLTAAIDRLFKRLSGAYRVALQGTMARPSAVILAALLMVLGAGALLTSLPSEYAPNEDRGAFFVLMRAPEGASLEYTDRYAQQMEAILMEEVETGPVMRILLRLPGSWGGSGEVNSARAIVLLKPWEERDENVESIAARMRDRLSELPGVTTVAFTPRSLGLRGDGRPVEMVLGGPDYEQLREWRDLMLGAMQDMPEIENPDSDYQERKPQMTVAIDRDRAAALGVSLAAVGRTLETMLGSRIVTTFVDRGREYNVILQGEDADRASPDDLTNLYVRSATTGRLIPLSNLVSLREIAGPDTLSRFDRMRAIKLEAGLAPGVSLGEAIAKVEQTARELLPASARISWDGEAAEFQESGGSLYWTFGMAVLIVFLVLAAQFESFKHPLIIMVTVPLALVGATIGLWLYGGTINVFTQIGAILLVGLSAKNGVLIVEFANQLRDRGMDFKQAVVDAAVIRLRPILMTSACTTFGALPLLLASGAGMESRQPIGVVIVFGVAVSALLTLFVVPALYALVARNTRSPQYVSRMIERLRERKDQQPAPSEAQG